MYCVRLPDRGPDYAKLMRKKEKSGNGSSDQISLEDLRASARSGDLDKARTKASRPQQPNDSSSTASPKQTTQQQQQQQQQQQPPPQQHHQGSFQIMSLAPDPNSSSAAPEAGHVQANPQAIASNSGPMTVPWPPSAPPPSTIPHPASTGRYAPDQFPHQSFMRSVIPQASPR